MNGASSAARVWIPGGEFRMGSDRHYAEEASARWGDEPEGSGPPLANHGQGDFPYGAEPGFGTTTRVEGSPPTEETT